MAQARASTSAEKQSPSPPSTGAAAASTVAGAATAAGLVGGAVLGIRYAGRRKRVLGVPVPGTGNSLARQIGKRAGRVTKAIT